jgi:hypothetical protein
MEEVKKARGPLEELQPLANDANNYLSTNVPKIIEDADGAMAGIASENGIIRVVWCNSRRWNLSYMPITAIYDGMRCGKRYTID